MAMQLLRSKLFLSLFVFFSYCSYTDTINGNWEALDTNSNYSELYFSKGEIKIYDEVARQISPQNYFIQKDSLITTGLRYKMIWLSKDFLKLTSDSFSINLRRIKHGVTLSNKKSMDLYLRSFYKRKEHQKGIDLNLNQSNQYEETKEEILEIKKN